MKISRNTSACTLQKPDIPKAPGSKTNNIDGQQKINQVILATFGDTNNMQVTQITDKNGNQKKLIKIKKPKKIETNSIATNG